MKFLALILTALLPLSAVASKLDDHAAKLVPLIDPAKLATLGTRAANPRLQKSVARLEAARLDGCNVLAVAGKAVSLARYTNATLAKLTTESLARNHTIADRLGVLNPAGLADMRRGQAATIQRGPYKGDELSVDHIIPRAVAPELENVIANLELMPLRMNLSKGAAMGERQRDKAKQFAAAGLLTPTRLEQILRR